MRCDMYHVIRLQPSGSRSITSMTGIWLKCVLHKKGRRPSSHITFLRGAYNWSFSWLSAVFVAALTYLEVFTISHQQWSITDTLWRAVDFHRSGRRGLSQKTAFIRRGFAEGKFSNYYPYILDHSIFDRQRATLRPGVIGVQEEAWEISSESAEEAEENPESQEPVSVAAKAAWGSASGPKEPPFPPPSKKPKFEPPSRSTQEGSSSSSAARAKPSEPTPLGVRSVSVGRTTEPTPLGVRSVSIGVTTDRATDISTAKSSGPKQPPPFLAKGSAHRAAIGCFLEAS